MTVEGVIVLLTVQEFGLLHHYLLSIDTDFLTSVDTVEEEVSSHIGYYVVAFGMKITDGRPQVAGNTAHLDVI